MSIENEIKPVFSFAEKETIEKRHRQNLFDDLLHGRTKFSAGPYEAHIQFSNFCNMSCIMCWDGNNPKTKKTDPDTLQKIGDVFGPHLSIVTPYSGSEPLVLSWDETKQMAEKYGILLCITTNVQYLDEKKFHELKDITETLILSIDSHIPAVFEKIRPRSNSKKVFQNLETAAKLSVEHNLECIVNVVLMTQNAPMLSDTLSYLADLGIQNVNVIQLLDVNGNSRMYDPLIHFSEEYVAWIKRNAISVARSKRFRLIWSVSGYAEFDFREPDHVRPKARKDWNDDWDERMKLFFPGFCRNAYGRLRVDSEGDVAPCCYATQGELSLGNVRKQNFEEIWNSVEAQDLRRGMFCADVPILCQGCRYHDLIKPFSSLPFVELVESTLVDEKHLADERVIPKLEILAPVHGVRAEEPFEFVVSKPSEAIQTFVLAISLGGQTDEVNHVMIQPAKIEDQQVRFRMPNEIFQQLKTNCGYWWMLWAIPRDRKQPALRCGETRCLIRHQSLPRLKESKLRYEDQGFVAVSDLGGNKQSGWQDPIYLPARPVAAFHGRSAKESSLPVVSDTSTEQHSEPGFLERLFGKTNKSGIKDGYLEVLDQQKNSLRIGGWVILHSGAADVVEIISAGGSSVTAQVQPRQDIGGAYPKLESAINAGFSAELSDDLFWQQDHYQFSIVARRGNRIEFRCDVRCGGGTTKDTTVYSLTRGTLEV